MARISESQKENISLMSVDLGGSMSSAQIRVESKGNPVLIIGLGGTGMDALLYTKQLINKRFRLPEDAPNKALAIPSNIKILGIDSDNTYFKKKTDKKDGEMRFAVGEYVSISGSVERFLSNEHLIPPYVKEWLDDPKRIYTKVKGSGDDGANGIRQSGRILLFNSINAVVKAITTDVQKLLTGMMPDQRLQVFILSGISGGTGSGTFLDIPYIVREIIKRQGKDNFDIMGFLFTPDVNLSRVDDPNIQRYIKRNGFAALQELEYLMDMHSHMFDPFRQRYSDTFETISTERPYDTCLFVSASGKDGFVLKNPAEQYKFSLSIAAEGICNFISSSDNQGDFSIDSFRVNLGQALAGIVPQYPMLNVYSSVGASAAILPKSEVLEYLSGKVFAHMNTLHDNVPTNEQRIVFLGTIGLDNLSVQTFFDSHRPGLFDGGIENPVFSRQALKNNKRSVEDMGDEWLSKVEEAYRVFLPDAVEHFYGKFVQAAELSFCSCAEGPFYIASLISSEDKFCLLKKLRTCISEEMGVQADLSSQKLMELKNKADLAYRNFVNKPLDITNTLRKDYYNLISQYYQNRADSVRCDYTIKLYSDLIARISSYFNDLIDNMVGILDYLRIVCEKNLNIVTGVENASSGVLSKTYEWKMYDIKSEQNVLEKLNEEISAVDLENAVSDILRRFLDEFKNSRSRDEFDVSSFICDAIASHFSETLSQSMSEFFEARYPSAASRADAAKELLKELRARSNIMYPCSTSTDTAEILYVSIPNQAGPIEAAADEDEVLCRHKIISPYTNRISIFTFGAGLAVAHHNTVHLFESDYYSFVSETGGTKDANMIGQHLYSTYSGLRDTDWFKLPSPIHDTLRPKEFVTENSAKVHRENEAHREIFNRALEIGIIDPVGNVHYDEALTAEAVNAVTYDQQKASSIKEAKQKFDEMMDRAKSAPVLFTLNPVNYMNATETDKIREAYVRTYGAWKYVEQMLDAYTAAEAAKEACDGAMNREKDANKMLKAMFDALFAGVIFKEKNFFRYVNSSGDNVNVLNTLTIADTTEQRYFYYYVLFEKFCELDDSQRAYIAKRTQIAHSEDIPDEHIEFLRTIKKHVTASIKAIDDMEAEFSEYETDRGGEIIKKNKKLREMADSSLELLE